MIHHTSIVIVLSIAAFATATAEDIDAQESVTEEESIVVDISDEGFPPEEDAAKVVDETNAEPVGSTEEQSDDAIEGQPTVETAPAEPELLEEEAAGDASPGLAVRVEKIQSGDQKIDPKQVRVLAPFPAKLLAKTPDGWRIEPTESAPHFSRDVELAPGRRISLTVRPHVLVPDADGTAVFGIAEPGYSAPLGYHQNATVGAILSTSIRQLDKDAAELGKAIDQLQQLLVSLPKTVEVPEKPPVITSDKKRQR